MSTETKLSQKTKKVETKKKTKVLVALDYDVSAQKVAEIGYGMGKAMKAEITLMHVVTDPVFYASKEYSPILGFGGHLETGQIELESKKGLRDASKHFLDKTKAHLGDKTIKTLVKEGDYSDCILEAAKELKVDIIVMGSHSRKWLQNIVIGSVSERVLHHTLIPVLIVPTRKK